jgi:hypothetical protein
VDAVRFTITPSKPLAIVGTWPSVRNVQKGNGLPVRRLGVSAYRRSLGTIVIQQGEVVHADVHPCTIPGVADSFTVKRGEITRVTSHPCARAASRRTAGSYSVNATTAAGPARPRPLWTEG